MNKKTTRKPAVKKAAPKLKGISRQDPEGHLRYLSEATTDWFISLLVLQHETFRRINLKGATLGDLADHELVEAMMEKVIEKNLAYQKLYAAAIHRRRTLEGTYGGRRKNDPLRSIKELLETYKVDDV